MSEDQTKQAQTIQVQVNCPHLAHMIMNGKQVALCHFLKADISNDIGNYCMGDMCPLKKYEEKKTEELK